MSEAALTVIAALGASALTGAASLWVTWFREHLRDKTARMDELAAAVTEMLSRSVAVMMRAQAIGQQMRLRSGFIEGLDVTLGVRKAADVLEFYDWLAVDYGPLNAAWSVIWTRGDQETICLANQLLDTCGAILGSATARNPASTLAARLARLVVGEKQAPQLQEDLQRALSDVAHAREQLAQYARKVLGLPAAQLFGHETPTGESGTAGQPDGSHPAISQA